MKQRVYLDTSVISAIDDMRWPDRAEMTRLFWERRAEFELCISEIARNEIAETHDEDRRKQMTARLEDIIVHPVTDEMHVLARRYIDAGIFPERVIPDALHVAAAVLTRSDILLRGISSTL